MGLFRLGGITGALYTVYDGRNDSQMIRATLILVWPYLRLQSSRRQNTECGRERQFRNFRSEAGSEMRRGEELSGGECTRSTGTSSWRSTLSSPLSAPTAGRQLFQCSSVSGQKLSFQGLYLGSWEAGLPMPGILQKNKMVFLISQSTRFVCVWFTRGATR